MPCKAKSTTKTTVECTIRVLSDIVYPKSCRVTVERLKDAPQGGAWNAQNRRWMKGDADHDGEGQVAQLKVCP